MPWPSSHVVFFAVLIRVEKPSELCERYSSGCSSSQTPGNDTGLFFLCRKGVSVHLDTKHITVLLTKQTTCDSTSYTTVLLIVF